MFDTIMGLPLHPLVVHAVVILAPRRRSSPWPMPP